MVSMPVPETAEGEVLIKVEAAGVNRPDVIQRQGSTSCNMNFCSRSTIDVLCLGMYPAPKGHSLLPGLEVAGTIVHSRSDAWVEGDQVCALTNGGGYAEFCAVPSGQVLPVPKGMDMKTAACIPESFFTVWHNVFQRGFNMIPGKNLAGL